jgi:hypothetical protein
MDRPADPATLLSEAYQAGSGARLPRSYSRPRAATATFVKSAWI